MRISDWSSDVCSSDLKALRIEEARAQRLAARLVVDDARDDMRESDALDPWRGAFEVSRFFAVELNEGSAIIHRLLLVAYLAEQVGGADVDAAIAARSEEHTSEIQSLMRNSYAVYCLKKKTNQN